MLHGHTVVIPSGRHCLALKILDRFITRIRACHIGEPRGLHGDTDGDHGHLALARKQHDLHMEMFFPDMLWARILSWAGAIFVRQALISRWPSTCMTTITFTFNACS